MVDKINSGGDDDEQEVTDDKEADTAGSFRPDAASTPYHGGEQIELQNIQHENNGLPDTSYVETPLLRTAGSITDLQKKSALAKTMKKKKPWT